MTTMGHYQNEIGKINGHANYTKFAAIKADSLEKLANLEMPHRRIENWKYTNLNKVLGNEYTFNDVQSSTFIKSHDETFHHCYFVDGQLASCDKEVESLLNIQAISKVMDTSNGEDLLSSFNKNSYFENDFADILNSASISNGHMVSTADNLTLEKPVFFHHHFTNEKSLNNYNAFYEIGKNSQLHILEEITADHNCFVNYKAHVKLEKDALFGHYFNQANHLEACTFIQINAAVDTNANYLNNIINTGSRLSRSNIFIELIGEQANADAHGLYLLSGEQHHDTMSYIQHSVASTFSNQLYKGILDDNSRGVFSGIIRIEEDAQLVAANQLNKN
jgi:Fe-S cluster assembly protein SufD